LETLSSIKLCARRDVLQAAIGATIKLADHPIGKLACSNFRGGLIEPSSDPIASLPGEKNGSGDQADRDKHPVLALKTQKSKMPKKKLHRSRPHRCAG
jgi:hypothetical protein